MINPLNRPLLTCGAVMVLCAWSGTRPRHRVESEPISSPLASQADEQVVDDLMGALRRKLQKSTKEYDAAVDRVEQAVDRAIQEATWKSGPGDGIARPLAEHPFFTLVGGLADVVRKPSTERKNPEEKAAVLKRFPWSSDLEYQRGLALMRVGDEVDHTNGFFELGPSPIPLPGFPDLLVNYYLHGLGEIVGWEYGVRQGSRPKYKGRSSKDLPEPATVLPTWERLRVCLLGTTPDVALFAIPQLTHRIHSRLAERRFQDSSEPPYLDELLTFLDSKWNGFLVEGPGAREKTAFVIPVHWLFTDNQGFVYQFETGRALHNTGTIPFLAVHTHEEFAKIFKGEKIGKSELVAMTPRAILILQKFAAEGFYLSAYKRLIDSVVRAILVPDIRFPTYMAEYDYPGGTVPPVREVDYAFDMPRRHALLVWAYVGKDPEALADFLYDEVLSVAEHRFLPDKPLTKERVGLLTRFLVRSREMESEMLKSIAERMAEDSGDAPEGGNATAGDFEREFSPHLTYRRARGEPSAACLAFSYHSFHGLPARVIREAAREAILKELEE